MANVANLVSLGGAGGSLRLLDRRIFTASGTWTKPADNAGNILAGTNKVLIAKVVGGGGGGSVANGGGGGGYSEEVWDISQIPATVTVTVGAAGTGGSSLGVSGNSGGNTSFGIYAFAGGGLGGYGNYDIGNINITSASNGSYSIAFSSSFAATFQSSQGGTGRYKGGAGAMFLSPYFVPSGVYLAVPIYATNNGGTGGGGAFNNITSSGTLPSSAGLTSASNTASSISGPGAGGDNASAGKNYGGGGGTNTGAAGLSGAPGVVVVEVWG